MVVSCAAAHATQPPSRPAALYSPGSGRPWTRGAHSSWAALRPNCKAEAPPPPPPPLLPPAPQPTPRSLVRVPDMSPDMCHERAGRQMWEAAREWRVRWTHGHQKYCRCRAIPAAAACFMVPAADKAEHLEAMRPCALWLHLSSASEWKITRSQRKMTGNRARGIACNIKNEKLSKIGKLDTGFVPVCVPP